MITVALYGKKGSRTIEVRSPRGFPTRHIRAPREINPPVQPSKPEPPAPVCPVLAALHKLTKYYSDGDGYFIFDEIFVTVRQECKLSRDDLLETLRSYYRDGQITFRPGYGSQLQFALKGETA